MANATLVVPPVYEVQLFGRGFTAVQITARTVKLMDANFSIKGTPSRTYNKFQAVAEMSFKELIDFVLDAPAKA